MATQPHAAGAAPSGRASHRTNPRAARGADSPAIEPPLAGAIRDSAQQIWQAGLGAFNRAQAEGGKAFEALVKEGVALQRKTQSVAEEKMAEAASRMTSLASDMSARASGQWDKLESIFEDRVARALNRLGVPSARDVEALTARIEALDRSVQQLVAASHGASAARKAARKVPRKTTRAPVRRPG